MPAPKFLLDTNILFHLLRADELGKYVEAQYRLREVPYRPFISIVTAAEIWSLVSRRGLGETRREALEKMMANVLAVDISDRSVLDAYIGIDLFSHSQGISMGKNDLWIAATAKVTQATLLTTDKDFDHLDPKYLRRVWIDPEKFRLSPIKDK
jgi:tRNA(fMet)-specific endonuclease VapC